MLYTAQPILAFLAVILVILPLPWHIKTKNIATLSLAFWLVQGNLFLAINAILWNDNVAVKHLRYCNIGTAFQTAGIFGLASASFCTVRNLERIASPGSSRRDLSDSRRDRYVDIGLCLVLPLVYTLFQYIVAPNQLVIFEVFGCQLPKYSSWTSIFIYNLPPLILGITTLTYAVLTIQWLHLRRSSIGKVLRASHASMTLLQFIRLMALAIFMTFFTLGYGLWQVASLHDALLPWISWDNVHGGAGGFAGVGQIPLSEWSAAEQSAMWANWSSQPASALVFFLLFAPTAQAISDVRSGFRWIKQRVGFLNRKGLEGKPAGAVTINSFNSRSMGTNGGISMPTDSATGSKSGGARKMKDDLSFDERDDDYDFEVSKSKGRLSNQAASIPSSKKTVDSSAPVNVAFPAVRRDSLLGAEPESPSVPTPTAASFPSIPVAPRAVNFSTEPPVTIPLSPVVSRDSASSGTASVERPERERKNYI